MSRHRALHIVFLTAVALPLASLAAVSPSHAQATSTAQVPITEDKPGLARRATVTADSARKLALARVPGGRITAAELEEEEGKLIYSFDIRVAGQTGIDEVHVDARSGAIVKVEHESASPAPAAHNAKPPVRKP